MTVNKNIKLVVITSNHARHRFFVNCLIKEFDVLGIVCESKRPLPTSENKKDNEIIRSHFALRAEKENFYFKGNERFNLEKERILNVPFGQSNSQQTFDFIVGLKPDIVILYGCSIIKPPILSHYEGKIINLHLGLSPYYRGAGTNFFPLVNREPECVGATIHIPILNVDAGPILAQVRPNIDVNDTCHDIGSKAIIAGTNCMIKCINLYYNGYIRGVSQKSYGRVYRNKDFNADAVRKMLYNFANGMIKEYLDNKRARDNKYPIVEI